MSGPINGQGLAAPALDPLGPTLRQLLPERSVQDKLAEVIPVTFGVGAELRQVVIAVLPIRDNRAWQAQVHERMGSILDQIEGDANSQTILAFLTGMTDTELDLLIAYDRGGLPDREWLETHATETQVLSAFLGVLAAAYPLAVTLLELVRSNSDLSSILRLAYSRSTRSAPPTSTSPPATSSAS